MISLRVVLRKKRRLEGRPLLVRGHGGGEAAKRNLRKKGRGE
jgi:hypothetical protein